MKYKGLHPHRFKDNPEEERFARAWDDQNKHGKNLAYLLDGLGQGSPRDPSTRDHVVAATVIQWLGSPVGQAFLRDLGYTRENDIIEECASALDADDVAPYITLPGGIGRRLRKLMERKGKGTGGRRDG